MDKVAAVILNYNGLHFLQTLLPSIIENTPEATVYVADNASTDDSVEFLKHNYPQVRLIILDRNYGFTGGYNRALAQIEAEYYAIINSDVEVTAGWLSTLIHFLEQNRKVAAVQPKILDFKNRNTFEYAGAAGGFIDKWGYPFCRGRLFFDLEKDHGQYDEPIEVFWATGACLVIRAALFHEMKGFDDTFFAHLEEIDLCWRLQLSGYAIFCVPASVIYHVGGGTLPKHNPRKTFLNFRNSLLASYKNACNARWIVSFRFVLDIIAAIKFMFQGQFKDAWAVLRAYFSFIRMVPKVTRSERRDRLPTVYEGSIVFDYFLRRIKKYSDLN